MRFCRDELPEEYRNLFTAFGALCNGFAKAQFRSRITIDQSEIDDSPDILDVSTNDKGEIVVIIGAACAGSIIGAVPDSLKGNGD